MIYRRKQIAMPHRRGSHRLNAVLPYGSEEQGEWSAGATRPESLYYGACVSSAGSGGSVVPLARA
jgi:hypothetical protein